MFTDDDDSPNTSGGNRTVGWDDLQAPASLFYVCLLLNIAILPYQHREK